MLYFNQFEQAFQEIICPMHFSTSHAQWISCQTILHINIVHFILFVDRVMLGGKSVYILNFRAHILICYLGYIILGISCFVVPIVEENIFTPHGFISLATRTTSTLSWILGKYTLKPKRAHIYTKWCQSPRSKTHGNIISSKPMVQAWGTSFHFRLMIQAHESH